MGTETMNPNEFVLWLEGYLDAAEHGKFEYIVDLIDPIKKKLATVDKKPSVANVSSPGQTLHHPPMMRYQPAIAQSNHQ